MNPPSFDDFQSAINGLPWVHTCVPLEDDQRDHQRYWAMFKSRKVTVIYWSASDYQFRDLASGMLTNTDNLLGIKPLIVPKA